MSTPETPTERIDVNATLLRLSRNAYWSPLDRHNDVTAVGDALESRARRAVRAEAALAEQSAQLATLQKEVEAHKEAAQRAVDHYKEGMAECREEGRYAALQFSRAADAANSILLYASRQAAAAEKESAK